jgi:hypothetical protein
MPTLVSAAAGGGAAGLRRTGPRRRRGLPEGTVEWEVKAGSLPGAESDDASHGIVRGDADGHTISGYYLDSKPPHPAAQLREHFVPRITLHAIEPARMDRHYRSLHVDQIVFTQYLILFAQAKASALRNGVPRLSNQCATSDSI